MLAINAPLVAIIGASGNQGRSVVNALIESDKPYRLRAIVRDKSKPATQELMSKGVDERAVDIAVGKEQALLDALAGAEIVFAMTTHAHLDFARELNEGKMIVETVKKSGARLFIWSGGDSYVQNSDGKYTAAVQYESKVQVAQHARSLGLATIVVKPGWFTQNFVTPGFSPVKQGDEIVYMTPFHGSTVVPFLVLQDYGLFVRSAIESGYKDGDEVLACSQVLTAGEAVKIVSRASGKDIKFVHLTDEQFYQGLSHSPIPAFVHKAIGEMLFAQRDFGHFGGKDVEPSRRHLAKRLTTFHEWAEGTDFGRVF